MNDEQRKQRAYDLQATIDSPGGKIILKHIEDEIVDGWESFINTPVDQKTSKLAFACQAKYQVLKGIREWIQSEIKVGLGE